MNKITPNNITELKENEVFVFGSNEAGRHGKGAAKTAMRWGAIYGKGEGIQGNTYAIPTKAKNIYNILSIDKISEYVNRFVYYAKTHQNKTFLVTEIGCGLAGYTPTEIAPLFDKAKVLRNVHLPSSFWEILK